MKPLNSFFTVSGGLLLHLVVRSVFSAALSSAFSEVSPLIFLAILYPTSSWFPPADRIALINGVINGGSGAGCSWAATGCDDDAAASIASSSGPSSIATSSRRPCSGRCSGRCACPVGSRRCCSPNSSASPWWAASSSFAIHLHLHLLLGGIFVFLVLFSSRCSPGMLVELQVQVVQVLEPPHRAVLSLLALQFPEAPSHGTLLSLQVGPCSPQSRWELPHEDSRRSCTFLCQHSGASKPSWCSSFLPHKCHQVALLGLSDPHRRRSALRIRRWLTSMASMTLLHGIIGCLCCLSHRSSMVEGGLRVHPPRRGKRLSTHCDGANPPELPGQFLASKACTSAIWTSISPGAGVDWTILVMMFLSLEDAPVPFCSACLIRGLSCDALDMNVQLFQLSLEDATVMRTAIDEKGSWATSLGQPKPAKDRQTLLLVLFGTPI